ncbi:MAG: hypothetical protein HW418_4264 [Anaerolineales bacterium]|nr:hypothetical protein [Anaerolineales bacterium]
MTLLIRRWPASQFLDRGSSTTYSSHVANQRTNISSIHRRFSGPVAFPVWLSASNQTPR